MSDRKSVEVALRVRPLVPSEISKGCKNVFEIYPEIGQVKIKNSDKAFTYNYIFGPNSTQDEVYNKCVQRLIDNLFNGYNVTVLAYGQTGSGKTHTMGTTYNGEGDMGVIPKAVLEIFNSVRANFLFDFTITVSFMELYQETLYDLLADRPREQCVLDIREDSSKGVVIPGLTQITVDSVNGVFDALIRGSSSRATSATNMNAQSSRSHAIITMSLMMQNKKDGTEKTAKFHLVDLAGSERPKKTGAVGTTFKEGVNINKGLLVLGNVISALGDEKTQHGYISYRDSNLTRLLKDSLGGNSITLMIACVSPADYNIEESVSTLRYADRARRIQNKPIVNQDPKAAEINLLKKTIQELKLQIVGQGGPMLSSIEITTLKEENLQLHNRIRDLTVQLSNTLHDNTGLVEKLMILQSANENLNKKIKELKSEYDVTLGNINSSFNHNDEEGIRMNLLKLQDIQNQFTVLDNEQQKTEDEMLSHEHSLRNSQGEVNNDKETNKKQEDYTKLQMDLNKQLQELSSQLAMKEHLARQISTNTQNLVDNKQLEDTEQKLETLQKEKEQLLQQLKGQKVSDSARKRIQDLETQISELKKKVQEQAHLVKLREKDMSKIKQLSCEILEMKKIKVSLIRKMRQECESFKQWKRQRDREMIQLKQQDRKKQQQIAKMEVMHTKQQNVLKRKVEEAVALNKRLKDALALRKAAQEAKNAGKNEKIGHWIRQEFDVHMHLVEAKTTLAGLLEDRATLQEQLDQFKENQENLDQSQIKEIEDDIEMRSLQIQELQQKLLESEDEKKSKLDNIQTMSEAKFAVNVLLEQATELKKNEVASRSKMIETQASFNEINQKLENLEKDMKNLECKHRDEISNLQKDYEDKIGVLLRQLRGMEIIDASEELRQRCQIQDDKIEMLDQANRELIEKLYDFQQENEELKEKIDYITKLAQNEMKTEIKTPVNETQRRNIKIRKDKDSTFSLVNENLDGTIDEEVDDITKDPDWKRTPIGKWLLEKKREKRNTSMLPETDKTALKRTSDGGCMCVKSNCALNRCGCKKQNRKCSSGCRCSSTSCTNRDLETKTFLNDFEEKKPRLLKERLFNDSEGSD